jgi:hypothetical protein
MIRLEVIPPTRDCREHFVVSGDEPFRVEYSAFPQRGGVHIMAYVYRGYKPDAEQEPIGCFDGTLKENKSWQSPREGVVQPLKK